MKKLRKLLIGLAGLTLSLGAAIGVGLNVDKENLIEVRAANADWEILGTGYANGTAISWDSGSGLRMGTHKDNVAYIRTSLKAGTTWKIRYWNGTSYGGWKGHNVASGIGSDNNYFTSPSDDNFCTVKDGVYDVYLTNEYHVHIDLVSTTISAASLTPTSNRYWFIQNQSSFWQGGPTFGVHAWNDNAGSSGTNAYYVATGYANHTNGNTFRYVDIPSDCTKISFMRYAGGMSAGSSITIWNESAAYSLGTSDWSRTKLHILNSWTDTAYGQSVTFSHQGATGTYDNNTLRPSAYLMSEVLVDYPTCSTSAADYSNLKANWWDNHDDSLNGTVATVTMFDYDYDTYLANGKAYEDEQAVVAQTPALTVQAKWNALSGAVSASKAITNSFAADNKTDAVTLVAVASTSAVSLLAVGGYFFIRKRKEF